VLLGCCLRVRDDRLTLPGFGVTTCRLCTELRMYAAAIGLLFILQDVRGSHLYLPAYWACGDEHTKCACLF